MTSFSSSDIALRKRAEVAAAQLAAIVQSSEDAIIGKTLDGIITSWNAGAEKVFGYAAGEMIGYSITRLIPPDREGDDNIILARIKRGESVQHFDTVRVKKDGGLIDVSVTVSPIKDDRGEVVGVSKVARDITECKRAEAAWRESEERFRMLVETAPDAIFIQTNGRFAYVNTAALELFGATQPAELLDQPVAARFHPDFRAQVSERIRRLNEERQAVDSADDVCLTLAGALKDAIVSAIPFTCQNQSGALVFARDVTKRKQAEQALVESESRFRQLAESLPLLVWTCQPGGPCDYLNRRWVEFTGVPEARQHGFGWLEQLHPDDRAPTVAAWEAAVAARADFRKEFRIRRYDGEYRWFDTQAVRLRDGDGQTVKWFGANTDMTERKQAEVALRESEEKFSRIFDSSPLAISLTTHKEGHFVAVNDTWLKMYEWSREEVVGHKVFELNLWADLKHRAALLALIQESGAVHNFEMELRAKSGRIVQILWSGMQMVIGGESCLARQAPCCG